jgi:WD40 repeat protein
MRVWSLGGAEPGEEWRQRHRRDVSALAVSRDGLRALTGSDDKTLKLWDVTSGKSMASLRGHEDRVSAVDLAASGDLAVSGDWRGAIHVWDARTKKAIATLETGGRVWGVAFCPEGDALLAAANDRLWRWSFRSGKSQSWPQKYASALAVSADGSRALVGDSNHEIGLWDPRTGARLATWKAHAEAVRQVAFAADGARALSVAEDVRLWDMKSGTLLDSAALAGPGFGPVTSISIRETRAILGGKLFAFELA